MDALQPWGINIIFVNLRVNHIRLTAFILVWLLGIICFYFIQKSKDSLSYESQIPRYSLSNDYHFWLRFIPEVTRSLRDFSYKAFQVSRNTDNMQMMWETQDKRHVKYESRQQRRSSVSHLKLKVSHHDVGSETGKRCEAEITPKPVYLNTQSEINGMT